MPGKRKKGINTMIVVNEELRFDFDTCWIEEIIVLSVIFDRTLDKMLSMDTIDESTIIPSEIEIPESENRFIVFPVIFKTVIEKRMHNGITREIIKEIFRFLKNKSRIRNVMTELISAEI